MRKNEDPRLSFSTPEFKEAQRIFTDGFKVTGGHCFCRLPRPPLGGYLQAAYPVPAAAEKLWQAGGVGAGEGPCLVYPTAAQAGQAGRCRASSWARAELFNLFKAPAAQRLCVAAVQVDVEGKPWPLDAAGNPILK
jgi:hypothetical protein